MFKAPGPNALEAFHDVLQSVWSKEAMPRLLQCSHYYSLQQRGEQVQLWKLQRHLTSFHSRNDLYSHSPEPTDHGNWKRSPRGAVWLQTRVQHHGHDFVIRQVQEKCIEQSKALFSVFIKSIWQRYLIQSTGRPSGWSWRDMAAQRSLWGWSSFLMMEWQDN